MLGKKDLLGGVICSQRLIVFTKYTISGVIQKWCAIQDVYKEVQASSPASGLEPPPSRDLASIH